MMFFCNVGLGVGIRILGLALLTFLVLACAGCPFKELLPMSVPRKHDGGREWGGVPSSPRTLLHVLFADS